MPANIVVSEHAFVPMMLCTCVTRLCLVSTTLSKSFQLPFQVCDLNVYRLYYRKLEQFGKILTLGVLATIIQVWVVIHNPGLDSVAAVLEV